MRSRVVNVAQETEVPAPQGLPGLGIEEMHPLRIDPQRELGSAIAAAGRPPPPAGREAAGRPAPASARSAGRRRPAHRTGRTRTARSPATRRRPRAPRTSRRERPATRSSERRPRCLRAEPHHQQPADPDGGAPVRRQVERDERQVVRHEVRAHEELDGRHDETVLVVSDHRNVLALSVVQDLVRRHGLHLDRVAGVRAAPCARRQPFDGTRRVRRHAGGEDAERRRRPTAVHRVSGR